MNCPAAELKIAISTESPAWSIVPEPERLAERACCAAMVAAGAADRKCEVSILLSDNDEVAKLNQIWRGKTGPTNVLSFPALSPAGLPEDAIVPLGDIMLAFGQVRQEAEVQGKSLQAHYCHLVIHGLLHLLGYDHEDDCAAERMEAIEIAALKTIGLSNPYKEIAGTGPVA